MSGERHERHSFFNDYPLGLLRIFLTDPKTPKKSDNEIIAEIQSFFASIEGEPTTSEEASK